MTGERYSGCPTWYPARLADGRDVRAEYPRQDWPFLLSSFKSNLMSSISIGVDRLRQVHPHNPVSINRQDGERLGLRNGDKVRIVTPGGSVIGLALLRDGIQPGAVGIEHGYGHTELGARAHVVGKAMPHNPALAAGVNLNDLASAIPRAGRMPTCGSTGCRARRCGRVCRPGSSASRRIRRFVRGTGARPRGRRLFSFAPGFLAALARANPR